MIGLLCLSWRHRVGEGVLGGRETRRGDNGGGARSQSPGGRWWAQFWCGFRLSGLLLTGGPCLWAPLPRIGWLLWGLAVPPIPPSHKLLGAEPRRGPWPPWVPGDTEQSSRPALLAHGVCVLGGKGRPMRANAQPEGAAKSLNQIPECGRRWNRGGLVGLWGRRWVRTRTSLCLSLRGAEQVGETSCV